MVWAALAAGKGRERCLQSVLAGGLRFQMGPKKLQPTLSRLIPDYKQWLMPVKRKTSVSFKEFTGLYGFVKRGQARSRKTSVVL